MMFAYFYSDNDVMAPSPQPEPEPEPQPEFERPVNDATSPTSDESTDLSMYGKYSS